MEEQIGGTTEGEPFDLETVFDLHDQCEKLRMARAVLGDEWVKTNLGGEAEELEADLRERREQARETLKELARH